MALPCKTIKILSDNFGKELNLMIYKKKWVINVTIIVRTRVHVKCCAENSLQTICFY